MAEDSRHESEEPIKVMLRLRPENQQERDSGSPLCLQAQAAGENAVVYNFGSKSEVFTYDHVADVTVTQEEVFRLVGKVVADNCLQGYNGTILAYGQTGSGKTYSMQGPFSLTSNQATSFELRGIIPRTIEYIFAVINREQKKSGDKAQYLCKCTFIEIYNEKVFDILESVPTLCHLREDIKRGVYVENVTEELASTPADAFRLLERGVQNRHVAATTMNHESSRSHSIFTLTIQSKTKNGDVVTMKESKFNLVDLAGSERQKDTNTSGDRLKEASNINKSLLVLRNVINALVEESNGKRHFIHYRDSKLTFLLKDSLGGNSKTFLIANVSPSSVWQGETLSTLRFAQCVKLIKNKVVLNEDNQADVAALKEHIRRLEAELQKSREKASLQKQQGVSQGIKESALFGLLEKIRRAEKEKGELSMEIQAYKEHIEKRDKQLQSDKMIIKFRDSTLATLQKKFTPETFKAYLETENVSLREEIKELRKVMENHPDVVKFAHENVILQEQLKEYVTLLEESNAGSLYLKVVELEDSAKELGETVVKLFNENCLLKEDLAGPRAESEEVVARLHQLKDLCEQYKANYDAERHKNVELMQKEEKMFLSLEQSKEREMELESELESAKNALAELERVVESTRASKDLEIKNLQSYVESLHSDQEGKNADSAQAAELRFELGRMEQAIKASQEETLKYKQKVAKLEQKARRMTDFASESRNHQEQSVSAFVERVNRLSAEASQKDAVITDLTRSLESRDEALVKAQAQMHTANNTLSSLQQDKTDLEMELAGLQQELDKKDEDYEALRHEKQTLKDDYQTLLDELQLHTGQAVQDDRKIKELTKAKKELEDVVSANMEHIANLEENLRKLTTKNEAGLPSILEESAQLKDQLRLKAREQELAAQSIEDHQHQLAQTKQRLQKLEEQLVIEKTNVNELSSKLKENKEERQQLLASYEDALEKKVTELREEHELAKASVVEDFARRENQFLQKVKQLEQQLQEASQKQSQKAAEHARVADDHASKVALLTQRIHADEFEVSGLKRDLQTAKSSEESLNSKLALSRERIGQLEAQVTDLQASQQELTILLSKNDQNENVEQLVKRTEHLEKQLEKEQVKNQSFKEQQFQLSKLIEELEAARKQKNDQIAQLKSDLQALKHEQASQAPLLQQAKELAGVKEKSSALERALAERQGEIQRQKREQEALRREAEASAAAAKKLEFSLHNAELNNEDLLAQMEGLKEMEEKAHEDARKYETEFKQLQEEMIRTKEEVERLRSQSKGLLEENTKLIQHSNTKQKLQYHVKIKQENNALQEELKSLKQLLTKHSIVFEKVKAHEKENSPSNSSSATSTPERELRSAKSQ